MAYDCITIFKQKDGQVVHTLPMLYQPHLQQSTIFLDTKNDRDDSGKRTEYILGNVSPDEIIPEKFQIIRIIIVT